MAGFRLVDVTAAVGGLILALAVPAGAEPSTFTAEGSDAVFGLGARHLAMGGTGTATSDDVYALYYNPANLAGIDRPMATVGRQLDAELRPTSFVGFAMPLSFTEGLGVRTTFALGRYPRIHAHSTGTFGADDFESIFLSYLLPAQSDDLEGEIDSKTLVNRFALGITPQGAPRLSFGANIDLIDCQTNTCGVDTETTQSLHATAVSYGLSVSYRVTDRVTLAAIYTDVSSGLDVTTLVTDSSGTTVRHSHSELPRRMAIEAAWAARDDLLLALGAQSYRGSYGDTAMAIDALHLGAEWRPGGPWTLRAGAWAPLRIYSTDFATPELLAPAAPTVGLGWKKGNVQADLAVFAHPVNSMHAGRPVISQEFSLTIRF